MLSREKHIEAINKFHDKFQELRDKIEETRDDPARKEETYEASMKYFIMTEQWVKIDDFCEFQLNAFLGLLDHESVDVILREVKDESE